MTGSDPEHILSFFYVFQAPLIYSREFRDYWEDMPYYRDYMTVVKQYERQLTKHFADLGYTYDAYADTAPNESTNPRNQFFQCDYLSYEMITKRRFPFLKRKQLSYNNLFTQTQENLALSIAYVDQHTDYDVDLIWANLIRTMPPAELQRSLGLQFILGSVEEKKHPEVLVCVRAEWKNAVDTVCEYLERIRYICEVQIYTGKPDVLEQYRKNNYFAVLSQPLDIEIFRRTDLERYHYNTDYNCLEKCYSIWICRDDIPKNDRYSISVYGMSNTKNTGTNAVPKENYDLMTLVVIKLGDEVYNGEKGDEEYDILRFLNAIMYPHKGDFSDTMSEYIDFSKNEELWKEVQNVDGLGWSIREEGFQALVLENLDENVPRERIIVKLRKYFKLSETDAERYYEKFSREED